MDPRLRAGLGVLAGIVAANAVFAANEWSSAYHPPVDLDFSDHRALEAWIAGLPNSVFYRVIAGYAAGALLGGWLTNRIARPTPYRPALVTGMALFFGSFVNLATIPHPEWFMWTATPALVVFAWLGGWVEKVIGGH